MEDEIISLLDEIETPGTALKAKEEEVAETSSTYEQERQRLKEEIDSLASDLDDASGKGRGLRKEHLCRNYSGNTSKIRDAGQRYCRCVRSWKEVCGGCHMNFPPQLYNELQNGNGPDHLPELQPYHLLGGSER